MEIALRGPAGEPVELWRTLVSHGVASLPPSQLDEDARVLTVTIPVPGAKPRTIEIRKGRGGKAQVGFLGPKPSARVQLAVREVVGRMLNLDEDLSALYAVAAADPELAWVTRGAGRMLRSPTVFEDVVKTIATTNCAWSATVRMVGAFVEHLGEPALGAATDGAYGRAFPTPAAVAEASDDFYKDVVRAGYRSAYFRALADSVASGALDLEALGEAPPEELSDEEVAERLLALPGVGPYAAAHIMMLLGRYSPLILDSWTRPKYARVNGRKASDKTIERRFRRY